MVVVWGTKCHKNDLFKTKYSLKYYSGFTGANLAISSLIRRAQIYKISSERNRGSWIKSSLKEKAKGFSGEVVYKKQTLAKGMGTRKKQVFIYSLKFLHLLIYLSK